jgi:hypothetical protein
MVRYAGWLTRIHVALPFALTYCMRRFSTGDGIRMRPVQETLPAAGALVRPVSAPQTCGET